MTLLLGLLGANAFWLLFVWMASVIAASYLSERKGYGERPGLACGLLLNFVGVIVWLLFPAKTESMWKTHGPYGTTRKGEAKP